MGVNHSIAHRAPTPAASCGPIVEGDLVRRRLLLPLGMTGHNSLFLGTLGDWTWDAVHRLCGVDPCRARNDADQPAYLSFFYTRVKAGTGVHLKAFEPGDDLEVATRLFRCNNESVYALHRVGGADVIPADASLSCEEFHQNPRAGCLYVEHFNRWVSRSRPGSNESLVRASPGDFRFEHLPRLEEGFQPWRYYEDAVPRGTFLADSPEFELLAGDFETTYAIDPIRDINGVGLLYFASYFTIVDGAMLELWESLGGTDETFLDRAVTDQQICFLGNADHHTGLRLQVRLRRRRDAPHQYVFDVVISRTGEKGKVIAISTVTARLNDDHHRERCAASTCRTAETGSQKLELVAAPRSTAARVAEVLAETLPMPLRSIQTDANMSDYGLTSLKIMSFMDKLIRAFPDDRRLVNELTPTTFFRFKTIAQVAAFLDEPNGRIVEASPPEDQDRRVGREPIAIIGMAGVFPRARDIRAFWRNLRDGVDAISEIPSDRPGLSGDPELDRVGVRWGGFISDHDCFDPLFFKTSPGEARLMDPQQRLFIQTVWSALEDAGILPGSIARQAVGLFAGVSSVDYQNLMMRQGFPIEPFVATGSAHAILANRISYLLDLHGPSHVVDTACSSSLVAVHQAVRAIRGGECDMALAGGVHLLLEPSLFVAYAASGMLSPCGRCRTFDQAADGYVRSEGVGVVVLKRLDDAIRDGDRIDAIIRGSAENHGGHTNSLTAPNPNAQAELLIAAYRDAGVSAETVSYIEAHGTGTPLGDPIEVDGLKQAFRSLGVRERGHCALGSVKTQIGHLEAAAGIAGLIKVVLSMQHRTLPGLLNFEEPNDQLGLENSPFYLARESRAWDCRSSEVLRAGVSSFGFGGANAHVVLESFPRPAVPELDRGSQLIPLSAANAQRLQAYAASLHDFLVGEDATHLNLADIAWTLQTGRVALPCRLAFVADSRETLVARLAAISKGDWGDVARGEVIVGTEPVSSSTPARLTPDRLQTLAGNWVQGADVDWRSLHLQGPRIPVSLPTYPFEKKRFWFAEAPADQDDLNFYRQVWRDQPSRSHSAGSSGPIMVIGVAAEVDLYQRTLTAEGVDLLLLRADPASGALRETAPGQFTTKSLDSHAYRACFELLKRRNVHPQAVLFLFPSVTTCGSALDELRAVFELNKALMDVFYAQSIRGCFVWRGEPAKCAHREALVAFARSVCLENPRHVFNTLVLDPAVHDHRAQVRAALAECTSAEGTVPQAVCYGVGQRQLMVPERVDIVAQNAPPAFRQRGVYLLTGGLGEIGSRLAHHLASKYRARLILLGRRQVDRAIESELAALRRAGAEVFYRSVDVTDAGALQSVMDEVRAHYDIDGVFHLARSVDDEVLLAKDFEDFARVVAVKMEGTRNLDEATAEDPLDFFVLFSSIVAWWGVRGSADYAYACAFQDAFARQRDAQVARGIRHGKSRAICWPQWLYDPYTTEEKNSRITDMGLRLMSLQSGLVVLEQVLAGDDPVLAVLAGEHQRVEALMNRESGVVEPAEPKQACRGDDRVTERLIDELSDTERLLDELSDEELVAFHRQYVGLASAVDDASDPREDQIDRAANDADQAAWGEEGKMRELVRGEVTALLEIETIDDETAFERYGLESILSVKLAQRIERRLDMEVPPKWLLRYRTVTTLAAYLVGHHNSLLEKV